MSPDAATLKALEWPTLLDRIAAHCVSEPGAQRVRSMQPADTLPQAEQRATLSAELLALTAQGQALSVTRFSDVSEPLGRAAHGGTLSGAELVQVKSMLFVAEKLRGLSRQQSESFPGLAAALNSDASLERLRSRLELSLDDVGALKDTASKALENARQRARKARDALQARLQQSLRAHAKLLSGQYYAEREGRYVLPVRADAHQRVEGIVLGTSNSGGTLYIEPRETTPFANQLKLSLSEVEREEERLLGELTSSVARKADAVFEAMEACINGDLLSALSRWAKTADAHVIKPGRDPELELLKMRHPLLIDGTRSVVENDMGVCGGRALVISGPNAGGKTVTLKCLGLATWMARAGIPIPAAPQSRVGWFGQVLADIGDEQSLERSLSTFSAHMTKIARILEISNSETLVLLDEVASGTDPEEGAALATAVLEALTEKGTAVAATTHYERLKECATREGPFDNASVGFDFDRMLPSFRLARGVPGPSSALLVAQRFGIPEPVLSRARAALPEHARSREEVLKRLERERVALETERADLRERLNRQAEQSAELEREKQRLMASAEHELSRETRSLIAEVRQARAQVRDTRTRLNKRRMKPEELRRAEREVSRAASTVAWGGGVDQHLTEARAETKSLEPGALKPGVGVRLRRLASVGTVEAAPERGQVRLRVGGLRMTVPLTDIDSIVHAHGPAPKMGKAQKLSSPPNRRSEAVAVRTPSNTLDLRGARVDEAEDRVDGFLDRMLGEGITVGFVLHGHGTGALKSRVREHLGGSRFVAHSRPGDSDEGGDAFTVFWLKE